MKQGLPRLALVLGALLLAALLLAPRLGPLLRRSDGFSGVRPGPDGTLLCYADGRQLKTTGLVRDRDSGWWYARDGRVDTDYTGFAQNGKGWWYVDGGRVDFEKNGLVPGEIGGETGDWYVLGGRVQLGYTGLSDRADRLLMVTDGRADLSFTGFAHSAEGWVRLENGRAATERSGLIEGSLDGREARWYVLDGLVQTGYRGLVPGETEQEAWCVVGGAAAEDFSGIFQDGETAWYCENGRVDRTARLAYTGEDADWIVSGGEARRVETESDRLLFRAAEIVSELVTPDMSEEEQLRACFEYMLRCHECSPRYPHLRQMDWAEIYAADIFFGEGGNCLSFAAAFAYLAKALGHEEVYACNSGSHGWAEVDGLVYDPEWTRHMGKVEFYALSYDSPLGSDYAAVLLSASSPRYAWMRVKI